MKRDIKAILNRKAYLERKALMKKFIEIVQFVIGIMLVMAAAYLVTKIRQQLGIPMGF